MPLSMLELPFALRMKLQCVALRKQIDHGQGRESLVVAKSAHDQ